MKLPESIRKLIAQQKRLPILDWKPVAKALMVYHQKTTPPVVRGTMPSNFRHWAWPSLYPTCPPEGIFPLKRVLGEKDMAAFQKKWEKFILALRTN